MCGERGTEGCECVVVDEERELQENLDLVFKH